MELENLINQLKFFGLKESLDYRLSEAIKDNLDYKDFLFLILDDEYLYRQNCRSDRLRKRAKFKDKACLEDFKCLSKRGISKQLIKQLATLYFAEKNENLIFTGGTGAGKTFLAQAIGHKACHAGIEVFFTRLNRLFKIIEAEEAAGKYLTFMNKLSKTKILILDDFGQRNYSHKEANIVYDILEDRYQKGSTIITSQVKSLGWKALFEDEVMAEAIFDRLTACSHELEVKGPSFRPEQMASTKMLENKET